MQLPRTDSELVQTQSSPEQKKPRFPGLLFKREPRGDESTLVSQGTNTSSVITLTGLSSFRRNYVLPCAGHYIARILERSLHYGNSNFVRVTYDAGAESIFIEPQDEEDARKQCEFLRSILRSCIEKDLPRLLHGNSMSSLIKQDGEDSVPYIELKCSYAKNKHLSALSGCIGDLFMCRI